jgi:hypothetical protein
MTFVRFKNFVGQSYTLRNTRFDCQRTVNLYPEVDETGAGKNAEIAQLTRTAGLTQLVSSAGTSVFGAYATGTGECFFAGSDGLHQVTGVSGSSSGWSQSLVASFSIGNPASITDNGISTFIASNGLGYSWTPGTSTLTSISTCSPTSMTYINGYVVMTNKGTNQFYWTDLYSTTVPALNFASAETNSDPIVAVFNNNEDLWLMGSKTCELWYDSGPTSGSVNTVFSRRDGILVETGCTSPTAICKTTRNRMIWLSTNDRGGPCVVQTDGGYIPSRVSTFPVEQSLGALSDTQLSQATAYTYTQDGHTFYVLNVPGLTTTWVFDVTTSDALQQFTWHERTYTNPSNGTQSRHLSEGHAYYKGKHVTFNYSDGTTYFLDQDAYSDNGDPIKRLRVTPHVSTDGKRVFYNSLTLDFKTGIGDFTTTDPQVMLRYSNDGGNTWSAVLQKSAGAVGSYNSRVIFHQLGQTRDRVFELSMTDPVDWAISGAALDIDVGAY